MAKPTPSLVPLSKLRPAPWNPRTITDKRFKALCASMEADPDFMWHRPIIAKADGEVVAGNMRLRAAEHLGWEEVPAILEDMSDKLAKERALKDNNQFGDWQEEELAEIALELEKLGTDLSTLGLDDAFLATLLDEGEAPGEGGEKGSLAARFGFPPFTILNGNSGDWRERKRKWLALGIQSETGRDGELLFGDGSNSSGQYEEKRLYEQRVGRKVSWKDFYEANPDVKPLPGTSIFDPVLCEVAYRWFCPEGGLEKSEKARKVANALELVVKALNAWFRAEYQRKRNPAAAR